MNGGLTDALARFVTGETPTFGDDVRELARHHVLDTLASIVACRDLDAARVARRYARANSGDAGLVTILGTTETATLLDAVFAGAMTGHAAEANDFIPSVYVQPGPAIVSTVLGICEDRALSGADALRAVLIGYELAARVPRAVGVANLRAAGLATHGVGPVFGAAAAAAHLLGLPRDRIGDVLSCCVQQASGSWQWLRDVEHIEKAFVFAGMGARNGVHAALLVEAGFRGVRDPFDDPLAWFGSEAFLHGDRDAAALVDGLDHPSTMRDVACKRYPVGGPAQPAVAALLDLVTTVDPADVERVEIAMPGRADAFRSAAMPALNLPYLTAIVLLDGRLDFVAAQSLDRMHHDDAVLARMGTVSVVHDPAQETGVGHQRAESARVRLTMRDGTTHERFVGEVPGFPSHPMTRRDIEDKARELLAPHLPSDRVDAVVDACWRLDDLPRAADLVRLVGR